MSTRLILEREIMLFIGKPKGRSMTISNVDFTYTCIDVYSYVVLFIHVYAYMYAYIYMHAYLRIYVQVNINVHTCIRAHMRAHDL